MDPTAALQALIGRETSQARPVAAAPHVPSGPKRGTFRSSGGGQAAPTYTAGDAAMALAQAPGRHSFVQNMGGFGTTGGFVDAAEGPRAVYGGWRVTDNPGATIDPRVQERGAAISTPHASDIHGAVNDAAMNLGPSLAQNQWRERQERMKR